MACSFRGGSGQSMRRTASGLALRRIEHLGAHRLAGPLGRDGQAPVRRAGRAGTRWRPRWRRARARCARAGAARGTGPGRLAAIGCVDSASRSAIGSGGAAHHPAHHGDGGGERERRHPPQARAAARCARRRGTARRASASRCGGRAARRASSPLELVEPLGEARVAQAESAVSLRGVHEASFARAGPASSPMRARRSASCARAARKPRAHGADVDAADLRGLGVARVRRARRG